MWVTSTRRASVEGGGCTAVRAIDTRRAALRFGYYMGKAIPRPHLQARFRSCLPT